LTTLHAALLSCRTKYGEANKRRKIYAKNFCRPKQAWSKLGPF